MSASASGPVVLAVAEFRDGAPRAVSLEMVGAGRRLADAMEAELVVAVAASDPATMAGQVAALDGVDRVVACRCNGLDPFLPGPWTGALTGLIERIRPIVTLVPGSITGRDYAARAAARVGIGLVPEVTAVAVESGRVSAVRSVHAGRLETTVTFELGTPAMMTVAAGAFPKASTGRNAAPIEHVEVALDESDRTAVLVDTAPTENAGKALASAQRIVAGGRGLGKPEHFSLVEDLARGLDAAVGASGAVVGAGWRPHADQVGSTGHTVSPNLYVAVGISGAPQHLVGMGSASHIVAINRDPGAPIFAISDFGIVGDLFEVVPAIVSALATMESREGSRAGSSQ